PPAPTSPASYPPKKPPAPPEPPSPCAKPHCGSHCLPPNETAPQENVSPPGSPAHTPTTHREYSTPGAPECGPPDTTAPPHARSNRFRNARSPFLALFPTPANYRTYDRSARSIDA